MIGQEGNIGDVIFWCTIIMVVLIVAGLGVLWLRRFFLGDSGRSSSIDVLTLDQLRELRRNEQITEDEFQALKSQIIAQFKPVGKNESD